MEIKLTDEQARKALRAWERSMAASEYGLKMNNKTMDEIGDVMEAIRESLKKKKRQA